MHQHQSHNVSIQVNLLPKPGLPSNTLLHFQNSAHKFNLDFFDNYPNIEGNWVKPNILEIRSNNQFYKRYISQLLGGVMTRKDYQNHIFVTIVLDTSNNKTIRIELPNAIANLYIESYSILDNCVKILMMKPTSENIHTQVNWSLNPDGTVHHLMFNMTGDHLINFSNLEEFLFYQEYFSSQDKG